VSDHRPSAVASYDTKCPACGTWIHEGDLIELTDDGEWVHEDCAEDE
jgi:hypothetical protein